MKVLFSLLFTGFIFISCNPKEEKKQNKHLTDSIAIDDTERAFFIIDSTKEYERTKDSTANYKK